MNDNETNNVNYGAGKGDKPRNCFSQKYRDNYDSINWEKNSYSQCYDENGIEINTNDISEI